jgi:hypothetical protein
VRVVIHKSKQNLYKQFLSVNPADLIHCKCGFRSATRPKTKKWKRRVSLVLMKTSRALVPDGIWLSGARVFFVV